jgi:hypothetical protein
MCLDRERRERLCYVTFTQHDFSFVLRMEETVHIFQIQGTLPHTFFLLTLVFPLPGDIVLTHILPGFIPSTGTKQIKQEAVSCVTCVGKKLPLQHFCSILSLWSSIKTNHFFLSYLFTYQPLQINYTNLRVGT